MPSPWRDVYDQDVLASLERLEFQELLGWLNRNVRDRGISLQSGQPLSFVDTATVCTDSAYEAFISATGSVPTRDNLHDRYNALIWLTAPQTKARLNHVQAAKIASSGVGKTRGSARDAATLWDENLAVIVAREREQELNFLLRQHRWTDLFLTHRELWHTVWRPYVFGHALLEKLSKPYPSITAHVLVIGCADFSWQRIDFLLSQNVADEMTTAIFTPLPVMGIPGWHPANEDPAFYLDTTIFRPQRQA